MSALQEFLVDEMQDLLHAENQLAKTLPKLAKAAHEPKLKLAFQKHTEETKGHIERLKQAFEILGQKAKAKPCKAMEGLVAEGLELLEEGKEKDEVISDLGLVAAAQKVEHYEMASYGTARTIAEQIGNKKIAKLLQQTLAEEEKTDKLLTLLSAPMLSTAANIGQEDEPEEE